ncbi:MAG: hypothetical protein V3R65_09340 [Acidiferrobacterales bacterium]
MATRQGVGIVILQAKFEQDIRVKIAFHKPLPRVRSRVANAVAGIIPLGDTGRAQGGVGETVGT